jgi:capsular polysaccharide biosynthesis protein
MNDVEVEVSHAPPRGNQEIDLGDMLNFVRKYFVILMVCTLLGMAGGIAVYSHSPFKWQADITLQIGKMPVMQKFDYIEQPVEVIQKITSPLFLSKMITLMYGKDFAPGSPTAQLLYKDLKVSEVKGSSLVKINVFGWTANEAYKNAGLLAGTLILEHRQLKASYLSGMRKRLAEVVAEIAQNRKTLSKVGAIEKNTSSRNETNALLRLALIDAKSGEIQKLKAEQAQLEEMLSASELQPTRIVGRSLAPQAPSSPKLRLLVIGGAFIGLLLGLLLSFVLLIRHHGLHDVINS